MQHKKAIAHRFSSAARDYDQFSFVQKEIGERLLERCQWLKNKPQRILNIGAASGRLAYILQKQYPKAEIIGIDYAFNMCKVALEKKPRKNIINAFKYTPHFICSDMERLPFQNKSFDLIISNCTLEWSRDLPVVFSECKRVLKEKGDFLFATVGPDTLYELAHSAYLIDNQHHVNAFLDMHHIVDMLLKGGWADPVVDREMMSVEYVSVQALLLDIKKSGSNYLFKKTTPDFKGKSWLIDIIKNYDYFKSQTGLYPASIEIIYGAGSKNEPYAIPTPVAIDNIT